MSGIANRALVALVLCIALSDAGADTLNVAADAFTNSKKSTHTFGLLPGMTVSNNSYCTLTTGATCTGFARFDLAPLPTGAVVDKAVLRIWVSAVVTPGNIDVVRVLEPWQEDTITETARPALGSLVASFTVASGDAWHFIDVDVTAPVQDWVQSPADNHGLALVALGVVSAAFDTKENPLTGHAPELEVVLQGPEGPAGPQGVPGPPGPPLDASCPVGSAIRAISPDGEVTCEPIGAAAPTGSVSFFDGDCPAGWTEYAALQGRVPLGLPTGAAEGTTQGIALTSVDVTRTISEVAAHAHRIDATGAIGVVADGTHSHDVDLSNSGSHDHNLRLGLATGSIGSPPRVALSESPLVDTSSAAVENDGNHTHSAWVSSAGSHAHTLTISPFDSDPAGSVGVDVTMPYVRLRACRKD
jgi:hypothetical protein